MIISASRRTDVPAFYAEWFMNRIRAGFCEVANPFNAGMFSRVPLDPAATEAIVFWTRDPRGLLPHLTELDASGYRYYFLFTLLDYPHLLESHSAPFAERLARFHQLSDRIGPERVIWRYDPIVLTSRTDVRFHIEVFKRIAKELERRTRRCVISFMSEYAKVRTRIARLQDSAFNPAHVDEGDPRLEQLLTSLCAIAGERGMIISSCAEKRDLKRFGILPGSCIDGALIERLFSVKLSVGKDPGQRPECRCVTSKDIGAYDTCLAGCEYCYATRSHEKALENRRLHDPRAPAMVPGAGTAMRA